MADHLQATPLRAPSVFETAPVCLSGSPSKKFLVWRDSDTRMGSRIRLSLGQASDGSRRSRRSDAAVSRAGSPLLYESYILTGARELADSFCYPYLNTLNATTSRSHPAFQPSFHAPCSREQELSHIRRSWSSTGDLRPVHTVPNRRCFYHTRTRSWSRRRELHSLHANFRSW